MPFTVDVGPFRGGDIYAAAGKNLGDIITKGTEDYMKAQKDLGADQVLLDFFQKQGMITPDALNEYTRGSHSTKTGMIAGLSRQWAAQQEQATQQRLAAEQAETAKYHQAALANEISRISIARAQEEREKAAQNFTPRPPMQFSTPPPGQTGIPYGPPTEEEAATPKVTMIEKSPGKWEQPDTATGGGTFIPPENAIAVKDEKGKVIARQIITGPKTSVVLPSEDVVTMKDEEGNTIGYRAGKQAHFGTTEKAYTPSAINSAFKNFDINASDIADPTKAHAVDIQGNEVASDSPDVVSIAIDTERGRRFIPKDAHTVLKSYVTGAESQLKRPKDMQQAQPSPTPKPTPKAMPVAGEVHQGYRFKGGNPANKSNWEKVL